MTAVTNLRNICIIAHVDHGKTTLVDHLMSQAGTYSDHEHIPERVMDSDDQERERGITISAKNASFVYQDVKVNLVDTPGHADFGGEVERIMSMVDAAILLVDAAEGPLPQTRFVLEKAIAKNLKIVLCINKVDRPEVEGSTLIDDCVNKTFDLFVELGANDEQCDFPIVFASAKLGWCTRNSQEVPGLINGTQKGNLRPLFDLILALPAPDVRDSPKFSMLVANLAYDDFLGHLAIGKAVSGSIEQNQNLIRNGITKDGSTETERFQVSKILKFEGLKQVDAKELSAGDIALIAGCENFEIGDTLAQEGGEILERIHVEEPTMRMIFSINTSPYSGKEGKAIQSRQLRDRLLKETRNNVALKLIDGEDDDQIYLLGRGELQFGIIIEKLRREGLEFMVGRPMVLLETSPEGKKLEPFERLTINIPEVYSGDITNLFQRRKGILSSFEAVVGNTTKPRVKIQIDIPTRGVIGTNSIFKTMTRGEGLINSETIGYRDHVGEILHRNSGSIVADRNGKTTAYALFSIQQRGELFVGEAVEVYEGMILGQANQDNDINVNVTKQKKLTNVRSVSSDGLTILQGIKKMSLELCIEWIDEDEWISHSEINSIEKKGSGGQYAQRSKS